MKLFTKDIDRKLFAQYPKGASLDTQYAVAKIFNPYGRGRWYLLNSDPNDPDYIWAIVQMGNIVEMGSVSRRELEQLRVSQFRLPLERDLGFRQVRANELYVGLARGKFYKKGGWVEANVTNEMRGESADEYGTFELYKRGGKVEVKILNRDDAYSRQKYNWLLGDFDSDGLANVDDKNPYDAGVRDRIDSPSIERGINTILDLKNTMDKNMYSFVEDLKNISPDNSKIYARTKTPYSIIDKLIKKRLLNPKTGLTDLIGTTIVTNDKKELDAVKKVIETGKLGRVIELEDMYANPKQGYRAYHFLVEKNGMPIELQLKTKRQKALNELSHEAYKLDRLDTDKLIKMTDVANKADSGDQSAIKQYNDFMQQPDLENSFYKYANGGYMEGGGKIFQLKKGDRYFSVGMDGGMRWNESPDLGYTYEREQAEALANRLRDNGDQVEIVKYNKDWWKMAQGGSVGKGNQEMLRSNVKAIGHHAKEIGSSGGKKEVEAWVVAKSERAATDLSDITHYLDGKKMANGGYMAKGGNVGNVEYLPTDDEGNLINLKVGDSVIEYKKPTPNQPKREYGGIGKIIKITDAMAKVDFGNDYEIGIALKDLKKVDVKEKMSVGGKVGFSDKVNAIKKSLLKRKKVSPSVQKDYGKKYSPKEAADSAKRIVGAMTASERLKTMIKSRKK